MCELFQECRRGNVLIETLRLDKDVRFKRSKAIIKYTTGSCCSKKYICCSASLPLSPRFILSTLFGSFLPEVKRKSHLHQAKLWWAALSVQKTWGFDSSHSMVINDFSTAVGPSLPSSAAGGWRQHMISAALITGLTGRRPGQHLANGGQSQPPPPPRHMGPGELASYMPFVYSLARNRKVQCCQVCL